tara:strand:- start:317 stop:982 length:666 start_codon:yes stop_codon:yes gene_type:complete
MRLVYHLPLSPFSRKVRLFLAEKKLLFDLRAENVWQRREQFLAINPAGQVPVLVDEGEVIADSTAIGEYLEEKYPTPTLIGNSVLARAEARRLSLWFDLKFFQEVTVNIAHEKMMKRLMGQGQPDSERIRVGKENIHYHLEYIGFLTARRSWLAGSDLTCADLSAGSQLSVIDYLGDVPWTDHTDAKNWYARLKSRQSFQPLLTDHMPGVIPSKAYADLDF